MSIEIADLSQLDPALVQQQHLQTTSRLQESFPELDLKRGVFHDTLAYWHALLAAGLQQNLQRYLSARSLQQLEADPSLNDSDETIVGDLLSNWGVSRQVGTKAIGEVTIVLSDDTSVTISRGSVFQANGREYTTTAVFTAKSDADALNDVTDRLLTQLSDGNWAFTIDVEAVEAGEDYTLTRDTLILPEALPSNFVTSFAAQDFTAGTNTETNQELLERLQQGIAAKTLSNRVNMSALLRQTPGLERLLRTSIVGYGDAEMLREQHSLFPVSSGGRVDWYVRSQRRLFRAGITKNAVLIAKHDDGSSTWQFALARHEAPGFYEIRNIRPATATNTAGGFTITMEHRGLDLTGPGFVPDIVNQAEGAYTSYQTAVIQFKDTVTDVTDLALSAQRSYTFEAVTVPLISEIQTLVAGRDIRHYGADALVKAPVPCFLQVSFKIYKQASEPVPDLDGIRSAVADVVNDVGFTGQLYSSSLHDVIHGFLYNSSNVSAIDMFGRILSPSGAVKYLRSTEVLRVTDDPANMVTAKTVQFFLEPNDVAVSVETSMPSPV